MSPPKYTCNSKHTYRQTDHGTVIDAPAKDPRDEPHVHRMSDFLEQPRGYEMINVLYTSELYQCANGHYSPDEEERKTSPSNSNWQVDPEWIHWAETEPRHPEDTHRREDENEDGLAFWIDLPCLFEKLIRRTDR